MYPFRYNPRRRTSTFILPWYPWKDYPLPCELPTATQRGTREGPGQIASQREPQPQRSLQELGYDNEVARRLRVGYIGCGKAKICYFGSITLEPK